MVDLTQDRRAITRRATARDASSRLLHERASCAQRPAKGRVACRTECRTRVGAITQRLLDLLQDEVKGEPRADSDDDGEDGNLTIRIDEAQRVAISVRVRIRAAVQQSNRIFCRPPPATAS
jgi:hypothetical protein